jgi:cell division septation protein DedD
MDANARRLLYLGGFAGLAILAGVSAYSLTGRSGGDTVPVVQPDPRPLKVKPENPGGMPVGPDVKQDDPAHSRLAPGTEEPNIQALQTLHDPARPAAVPSALMPAHGRTFAVQLSSAKSEAEAQAAWDRLTRKMPELIGQHRALFQKTNEAGPAPWRLRTGGFTDAAQAKAFCEKLKAKGGQCTVVES